MSCPYANALGEPGTGFHSWRIGGIAAGDTIATIIVAIITSYLWGISIWVSLAGWFIAGEIAHWIFGTQTAVLVGLGLEPRC
jgi:hypothetical protein